MRYMLLVILLFALTGCASLESEKVACRAMFEDGPFEIGLNETSATSCDEYAGAIVFSGVCRDGVFCETFNEMCVCFHSGDFRNVTYSRYLEVRG